MIIFEILLQYIFFALAIGISFYIPGLYSLSLGNNSFTKEQKQFLAWPLGYSSFILLSYIGGWIRFPWLSLLFVVLISLYVFIRKRFIVDFSFPKTHWVVLLLITLGSLAFTGMSFFSGMETAHGLQFVGTVNSTDGLMHIAHIKTQVFSFPPPSAGFAGYSMHGYHYFYDFLLSRFSLFFHFSANDLFYRLFPFAISLFYGASLFFFSKLFTQKKSALIFILFFGYFAESWGFILSLFTKLVDINNGLGLVQPLELVLDPSAILAFAIMLCGFYVLFNGKLTVHKALIIGLLLGVLAELKVYAGILSILTLGILIIYFFITKKSVWMYVLTEAIIGFLTAVTYLPNNMGVGHLFASPFFLYSIFVSQNQLFRAWDWDMRMYIYQAHHNIPHITFMYVLAFFLFWVLTLGTRVFVIFSTPALFKKNFWKSTQNICFVLFIIIPLFIGSMFVQSFSIFSTIQFLWIVGLLIAIPAGIFYGKLYDKFSPAGKIGIVIFLLFCSGGSVFANEHIYLIEQQGIIVSPAQMNFTKTIQQRVGEKEFFVVAPTYIVDKHEKRSFTYYEAPFFSAMTGRITYYEYETPEYSDKKKIDYRKQQIETITLSAEKCDEENVVTIMKHIGTSYLVTLKSIQCKNFSHMKRILTAGDWAFWVVK